MADDINDLNNADNSDDQSKKRKVNRLIKSRTNKLLFGVCGGIGEFFRVDPIFIRLLFVFSLFIGGWGVIVYFILIIAMPGDKERGFGEESRYMNLQYMFGIVFLFGGIYLLFRNSQLFLFFNFFGLKKEIFLPFILAGIGFTLLIHKNSGGKYINDNKIYSRSVSDRKIFGVCGGFSSYFNIDSTTLRLIWIIFSIITVGTGILIYFIFTFLSPSQKDYFFAEHI